MKTSTLPIAAIALLASTTFAQSNISLAGKVVDAGGKPVAQAIVRLADARLADTTDGQGAFTLVRSSTGLSSPRTGTSPGGLSASVREDFVDVQLAAPGEFVLAIHDFQGRVFSRDRRALAAGSHALVLGAPPPGIYLLAIRSDRQELILRALFNGNRWSAAEGAATPIPGSLSAGRLAATFSDTLKVAKNGFEDFSLVVSNPVQSGLVLQLKPRSVPPLDSGILVNGCRVRMEGWARYGGTTGGGNATPQKVTSVDELRTLSKDTVPRVLLLEGTYDLGASYLKVGSNKTFIGQGKNTVVKASVAGFSLRLSHNVIMRNFTVQGGGDVGTEGGDAVTATQADRLWFDHLTIIDGPDGILDLTQGTTNATVSWCKIYYTSASQPHRYAMQFSSGSYVTTALTDRGKLDITMHHNWFGNLVDQRMPRHLWGRGHIYNTFYNSPNNTYCIGAGSWASILIENNYFKDVNDPHRYQDDCPTYLAASGNIYDNAVGKKETGLFAGEFPACLTGGPEAVVPGPWKPPYAYVLDEAKDVPALVQRCAGPQ